MTGCRSSKLGQEFFRDLLQPGFVNRRIESLKKKLKSLKKDKNESEAGLIFAKIGRLRNSN